MNSNNFMLILLCIMLILLWTNALLKFGVLILSSRWARFMASVGRQEAFLYVVFGWFYRSGIAIVAGTKMPLNEWNMQIIIIMSYLSELLQWADYNNYYNELELPYTFGMASGSQRLQLVKWRLLDLSMTS